MRFFIQRWGADDDDDDDDEFLRPGGHVYLPGYMLAPEGGVVVY